MAYGRTYGRSSYGGYKKSYSSSYKRSSGSSSKCWKKKITKGKSEGLEALFARLTTPKRGNLVFRCFPNHSTKVFEKNGKKFGRVFVTVVNTTHGSKSDFAAFVSEKNNVYIPELRLWLMPGKGVKYAKRTKK